MPALRPVSGWTRGAVVCAPLAALLTGLSGCGDAPVPVDSPPVSEADRATCEEFLQSVPDELAGHRKRLISPAAALGAAWGEDPPIVLTCGVTLPDDFDRFAACEEANGVGWFLPEEQAEEQSADVTLTTAGYRPIVQVELPGKYRGSDAAAVMAELASPVEQHLELVQPCR